MSFPQIGLQAVLDTANFKTGLGEYTRGIDAMIAKTGIAADSVGGQFASLGSSVLGFGAKAATVAAVGVGVLATGIGILGVTSVKAAISVQDSFAGVAKTIDGLTDSYGKLTPAGAQVQQSIRNIAKEVPYTVEQLNALAAVGGTMGVAKEQLGAFTKTVAELDAVSQLKGADAAEALGKINVVMGTTAREGAAGWQKLGNAIVAVGNAFPGSEKDIAAYAERLSGAGKVVHLTEGDIIGIGSALTAVGVEAQAGGTAVQKVLLNIQKATIEGGKSLDIFAKTAGVSSDEFKTMWQTNAGQAFQKFVDGLGKQGKNAILTLDDLGLKDARLERSFLSLASTSGTLDQAMALANNEFANGNALQTAATAKFETTASRIQILKNQLRDVAISLGIALLPAFNGLLDMLTKSILPVVAQFATILIDLINNSNTLGADLSKLPGFLQPVAIAIGSVVTAVKALIAGNPQAAMQALGVPPNVIATITQLATTLGGFITGTLIPFIRAHLPELKGALIGIGVVLAGSAVWASILAIAGAVAALANPVTLVIGLAALLGAAWAGNWGNIRGIVGAVIGFLGPLIGAFIGTITSLWSQHGAQIQGAVSGAWRVLQGVVSSVVAVVGPAVTGLIAGMHGAFTAFQPVIQRFGELWQALGPLIQVVATIIGAILTVLFGIVSAVFAGIAAAVTPLIQTFAGVAAGIIQAVTGVIQFLTAGLQFIVALFTNNSNLVTQANKNLDNGLRNIWQGLTSGIIALVTGFVRTTWALVSGFVDGVIKFFTHLYDTLIGHSIIPDLVNGALRLFTQLSQTGTQIFQGFTNLVIAILSALQLVWNTVWTAILNLAITVWNAISTTVNNGINGAKNVIAAGIAAAQSIWNATWNAIQSTTAAILGTIVGIVSGAVNTIAGLVGKIGNMVNQAEGYAGKIAAAASSAAGNLASSAASAARSVGTYVTQGFNAGVSSGTAASTSAVSSYSQTMQNKMNRDWGINSPAEVTQTMGRYIGQGLVLGIQSTSFGIGNSITAMMHNIIGQAQNQRYALPGTVSGAPVSNTTNIDRRVFLEMNPQYANYQSPASVYYDATAALSAARQ